MKKVYTRTGDDGTTGIFGGERVSKDVFVMARYEMYRQHWTEEKWKSFGYKRKASTNRNPESK